MTTDNTKNWQHLDLAREPDAWESPDDRTRVLLRPVTGRSHQLRIHMRELGHPILGCDMYAHQEALEMAPRLMLHATTLAFEHPRTGEWIEGECPPDF